MPVLPRFIQFLMGQDSVNSAAQRYKRATLLSTNRKRPGTNSSSRWYGANSDTRGLPHSCFPLDRPSAFPQTRTAQDGKSLLASAETLTKRHEVDEESLAGLDKGRSGNITKTTLVETRREHEGKGKDGGPVEAPDFGLWNDRTDEAWC